MAFKTFHKAPEPVEPDFKVVDSVEIKIGKHIREEVNQRTGGQGFEFSWVSIEVDEELKRIAFEFWKDRKELFFCASYGSIVGTELIKAYDWIKPGEYDAVHNQGNQYIVNFG